MAHQLTEPNTTNPLLASRCQVSLNLVAAPVAFTAIFDVYTRVYRGNDK